MTGASLFKCGAGWGITFAALISSSPTAGLESQRKAKKESIAGLKRVIIRGAVTYCSRVLRESGAQQLVTAQFSSRVTGFISGRRRGRRWVVADSFVSGPTGAACQSKHVFPFVRCPMTNGANRVARYYLSTALEKVKHNEPLTKTQRAINFV